MVFPGWRCDMLRYISGSAVYSSPCSEGADGGVAKVNEVDFTCLVPETPVVAQGPKHDVIMGEESQEIRSRPKETTLCE